MVNIHERIKSLRERTFEFAGTSCVYTMGVATAEGYFLRVSCRSFGAVPLLLATFGGPYGQRVMPLDGFHPFVW